MGVGQLRPRRSRDVSLAEGLRRRRIHDESRRQLGYEREPDLHAKHVRRNRQRAKIERASHEFVLEWTNFVNVTPKDRLTFGALYNYVQGHELYLGVTPSITISDGSRPGEAAYAQLDHRLASNLKVIGGFQANKIGALDVDVVPRAGVIWAPDDARQRQGALRSGLPGGEHQRDHAQSSSTGREPEPGPGKGRHVRSRRHLSAGQRRSRHQLLSQQTYRHHLDRFQPGALEVSEPGRRHVSGRGARQQVLPQEAVLPDRIRVVSDE